MYMQLWYEWMTLASGGETFARCPEGCTTRHNGGCAVPAGNSCPRPPTRSDSESSFLYLKKLQPFVRHVSDIPVHCMMALTK